jgi:hypothetical protein
MRPPRQRIDYIGDHRLHRLASSGYEMVSRLPVKRIALLKQLGDSLTRIGGAQKGALSVVTQTHPQFRQGGDQVDHHTPAAQRLAVFLAKDDATAGGKHQPRTLSQLFDERRFAPPKALLALQLENRGDRHTQTTLKLPIRINEGPIQGGGKPLADGGFTAAHHADQKDRLLPDVFTGYVAHRARIADPAVLTLRHSWTDKAWDHLGSVTYMQKEKPSETHRRARERAAAPRPAG